MSHYVGKICIIFFLKIESITFLLAPKPIVGDNEFQYNPDKLILPVLIQSKINNIKHNFPNQKNKGHQNDYARCNGSV